MTQQVHHQTPNNSGRPPPKQKFLESGDSPLETATTFSSLSDGSPLTTPVPTPKRSKKNFLAQAAKRTAASNQPSKRTKGASRSVEGGSSGSSEKTPKSPNSHISSKGDFYSIARDRLAGGSPGSSSRKSKNKVPKYNISYNAPQPHHTYSDVGGEEKKQEPKEHQPPHIMQRHTEQQVPIYSAQRVDVVSAPTGDASNNWLDSMEPNKQHPMKATTARAAVSSPILPAESDDTDLYLEDDSQYKTKQALAATTTNKPQPRNAVAPTRCPSPHPPDGTQTTQGEESDSSSQFDYVPLKALPESQFRAPSATEQASSQMQFYRDKLIAFFQDDSDEEADALLAKGVMREIRDGSSRSVPQPAQESAPPLDASHKSQNSDRKKAAYIAGAGVAATATAAALALANKDKDGSSRNNNANMDASTSSRRTLGDRSASSRNDMYSRMEQQAKASKQQPKIPPTIKSMSSDDTDDSYNPNALDSSVQYLADDKSPEANDRYRKMQQEVQKAKAQQNDSDEDSYDPNANAQATAQAAIDKFNASQRSNNFGGSGKNKRQDETEDDNDSWNSHQANEPKVVFDIENGLEGNDDDENDDDKYGTMRQGSSRSQLVETKEENSNRRVGVCRCCLLVLLLIGLCLIAMGVYIYFFGNPMEPDDAAATTPAPTTKAPVFTWTPNDAPSTAPVVTTAGQESGTDAQTSPDGTTDAGTTTTAPSLSSPTTLPPSRLSSPTIVPQVLDVFLLTPSPSPTLETTTTDQDEEATPIAPSDSPTQEQTLEQSAPPSPGPSRGLTATPTITATSQAPTIAPTTASPSIPPTPLATAVASQVIALTPAPSDRPLTPNPTTSAPTPEPTVPERDVTEPPVSVPVVVPEPTTATTPEEMVILENLPDETWEYMRDNPMSPQAHSFRWMVDDPYVQDYPQWQQEQRFALVTMYHSWFDPSAMAGLVLAAEEAEAGKGGPGGPPGQGVGRPRGKGPKGKRGRGDGEEGKGGERHLQEEIEVIHSGSSGHWLDYESPECQWQYAAWNRTEQSWSVASIAAAARRKSFQQPACDMNDVYQHLTVPTAEDLLPGTVVDIYMSQLPPEISMLTDLSVLHMPNNKVPVTLEAFLPDSLTLLSSLEQIDFSQSNILEWTPPSILRFPRNLGVLDLSYNQMKGELFMELGLLLTNLEELYLDGNALTGTIPIAIPSWTRLRNFHVSGNALTGNLPSEIGWLSSHLEVLSLSANQLEGDIPTQIGALSLLASLDLDANSFWGSIPSQMGGLTNLAYFGLADNSVRGSIPPQLGNLSLLDSIRLSNNRLTGRIPSQVGLLSALTNFQMHGNRLQGSLPTELGSLSGSLYSIDLHDNQLEGTLFTEIGNLVSTNFLYLYENSFTGSIPSQIGLLEMASYIGLESNKLSGSIPTQVGYLKELRYLHLSDNLLTSTIPIQLGTLPMLKYLFLGRNKLSGEIPSQLGLLTGLRYLDLGGGNDDLKGTVPAELCALTDLTIRVRCSRVECDCGCQCA